MLWLSCAVIYFWNYVANGFKPVKRKRETCEGKKERMRNESTSVLGKLEQMVKRRQRWKERMSDLWCITTAVLSSSSESEKHSHLTSRRASYVCCGDSFKLENIVLQWHNKLTNTVVPIWICWSMIVSAKLVGVGGGVLHIILEGKTPHSQTSDNFCRLVVDFPAPD